MKKLFLSLAIVAIATPGAFADEVSFDFTGTVEKYGIPFQASTTTKDFVSTPYVIEEGEVAFTLEPTTNGGYARCGNSLNNGLWVSGTASDAAVSISVPDGTISKIEFKFTSMGWPKFEVDGVNVPYDSDANSYIWTGAKSKVKFDFTEGGQYITIVNVVYSAGTGQKQEAELAFESSSASVKLGDEFTAPALKNPNGLTVSWESSDTAVATVDAEGIVTVVGKGTTTITASSVATDKFEAGTASYTLKVYEEGEDPTPVEEKSQTIDLTKIFQINDEFPQASPYVITEEPVTLTFTDNGSDDNPFAISNKGLTIKQGTGTIGVTVADKKINKVEIITPAQITLTANGKNLAEKELADYSSEYTWERPNDYEGNEVVIDYNTNVWGDNRNRILTSVIVYYEDGEADPDPVFPESFQITSSSENLNIQQMYDEDESQVLVIVTGKAPAGEATLTIEIPEGWDGMLGYVMDFGGWDPTTLQKAPAEWIPVSEILKEDENMKKGNVLTVPVGNRFIAGCLLCKGEYADNANSILISGLIEVDESSSVENLGVADADAEYYNLQGVKVSVPAPGVYVKVANGKAEKIVIR